MSGAFPWWAVLIVALLANPAHAQDPTATLPDGNTVPTWIFLWTLGLGSAIIGSLLTALRVLWGRMHSKEQEIREYYEGTLEQPDKGVIPRIRKQYDVEKKDQRDQIDGWRTKFEESEAGRRADVERMRLEERESMKDGMHAMRDVAAALQESSSKMDTLIAGYGEEEEEG